jgi:uncharacterized RDD family membrane protein YckC
LNILLAFVALLIGWAIWELIVWGRGQFPAYQVLGMRCWRVSDTKPATFGVMALRNIVGGIVEGLISPITQIISFVLFVSDSRRQSIRDRIGGTVVLHDPAKVLRGR